MVFACIIPSWLIQVLLFSWCNYYRRRKKLCFWYHHFDQIKMMISSAKHFPFFRGRATENFHPISPRSFYINPSKNPRADRYNTVALHKESTNEPSRIRIWMKGTELWWWRQSRRRQKRVQRSLWSTCTRSIILRLRLRWRSGRSCVYAAPPVFC